MLLQHYFIKRFQLSKTAFLKTKHLEDMSNDPEIVNLPFDAKS
jgi:hypothetical protein